MSVEATPLAGQLLIALPALADPNFARSVTLICQHNPDGAMGVVVNRVSEYTLGDVLAQMDLGCDDPLVSGQPVLAGGPVHPERGFVIHDGDARWDSSMQVQPGLHVTTSRDVLDAIARGEGPQRVRVALGCVGWRAGGLYLTTSRDVLEAMAGGEGPPRALVALGCAGWGPGQPEHELAENTWLNAPADTELLFAMPLEARWQAAAGLIGVDMLQMAGYMGRA